METNINEISVGNITKEMVNRKRVQTKTMILTNEAKSQEVRITNKTTSVNFKDKKIVNIREWKNYKDDTARIYEEQMDAFIDGGLDSCIAGLRYKFLIDGCDSDTAEEKLYLFLEMIGNLYKISQATCKYDFFKEFDSICRLNK